MISHRYQCIFVEVPKTGSTSIRAIIGHPKKPHLDIREIREELLNEWTYYRGPINKVMRRLYRLTPSGWRERAGERRYREYFKFGFVRNPWDRTVSLYERKEGQQLSSQMSFKEFVEWIQFSSDTCIHPSQHKYQLDWFLDQDGNQAVDFIGKFENLQADWLQVADKIGAPPDLPRKNVNPRIRKPYWEYYDTRSRAIIGEKFKRDIEFFDYAFGV